MMLGLDRSFILNPSFQEVLAEVSEGRIKRSSMGKKDWKLFFLYFFLSYLYSQHLFLSLGAFRSGKVL